MERKEKMAAGKEGEMAVGGSKLEQVKWWREVYSDQAQSYLWGLTPGFDWTLSTSWSSTISPLPSLLLSLLDTQRASKDSKEESQGRCGPGGEQNKDSRGTQLSYVWKQSQDSHYQRGSIASWRLDTSLQSA